MTKREGGDDEKGQVAGRKRVTTFFGWLAGAALALVINHIARLAVGDSYPTLPLTFGAVVVGAFSGMYVADRVGPRGFRPLGIAAGILLSVYVVLLLVMLGE